MRASSTSRHCIESRTPDHYHKSTRSLSGILAGLVDPGDDVFFRGARFLQIAAHFRFQHCLRCARDGGCSKIDADDNERFWLRTLHFDDSVFCHDFSLGPRSMSFALGGLIAPTNSLHDRSVSECAPTVVERWPGFSSIARRSITSTPCAVAVVALERREASPGMVLQLSRYRR